MISNQFSSITERKEENNEDTTKPASVYNEAYRPQFHFSTKKNWINDPNGLIKIDDTFHMYYQYNPLGIHWGHISWGHATSKDLIHWQEHPVAIPENKCMIFSGTTALDDQSSGKNKIIAAYTSFEYKYEPDNSITTIAQHQSIAVSKDGGFSYQPISQNPVLDIGAKEFRDPKIFYDERTQKWNMLVSLADKHQIIFYQSDDLTQWTEVSRFGPLGNTEGVWECPDLFCLQIKGTRSYKWILTLSAGHPQKGFLGMQYFIGDFDGIRFVADDNEYPLYLDYGKDFYAGITFSNLGHQNYSTMIGWLGCHLYSKDMPTIPWRGAMSLPRDLYLANTNQKTLLKSMPPTAYLKEKLGDSWMRKEICLENNDYKVPLNSKSFVASFSIQRNNKETSGIKVFKSGKYQTIIGVDFTKNEVFIDRRNAASYVFNKKFPSIDSAPISSEEDMVTMHVYVDHSIIEVFIQDGEKVITSLVYPEISGDIIELFSVNGIGCFKEVQINPVETIWK